MHASGACRNRGEAPTKFIQAAHPVRMRLGRPRRHFPAGLLSTELKRTLQSLQKRLFDVERKRLTKSYGYKAVRAVL